MFYDFIFVIPVKKFSPIGCLFFKRTYYICDIKACKFTSKNISFDKHI